MEGQRGEVSCPRPDRPGLGGWELRSKSPSAAATQEPCWQWAGFRGQEEEVRGEALFPSVYKCSWLPWHRCGWLKCMLESALPLGRWEPTTLLCNNLTSCRGAARHCVVKGGAGMFGLSAGRLCEQLARFQAPHAVGPRTTRVSWGQGHRHLLQALLRQGGTGVFCFCYAGSRHW